MEGCSVGSWNDGTDCLPLSLSPNCQICLFLSPAFALFLAFICFVYLKQPIAGVIFIVMALLNLFWIYVVRSRIQFSAHILTISVQVLQNYPATTGFALIGAVMQLVWVFVWIITAAVRLETHTRSQ
jgi:hypothetical protein